MARAAIHRRAADKGSDSKNAFCGREERTLVTRGDAYGHVVRRGLQRIVKRCELDGGAATCKRSGDQPVGDSGVLGQDGAVQVRAHDAAVQHALAAVLAVVAGAVDQGTPEGLLANSNSATWMIVLFVIWTGFGGNMLLFGGAMARVPIDVLEAARLEGCGPFRELVQIILPLIWPTICTMLIFTFTGIVNSSGPILLFTNGDYETTTINFWIFLKVYGQQGSGAGGEFGIVSATGLCFTLVTVPIILIVRWALERVPTSEY